ncbi:unnamed protein product [Ectocarpus sp. 8 AP-2014]
MKGIQSQSCSLPAPGDECHQPPVWRGYASYGRGKGRTDDSGCLLGHRCVHLSGGGVFFVVGPWIHVPINFSGIHFPPVGKHAEGPGVGREGGTQTGQTLRNENGGHACACGCCERGQSP